MTITTDQALESYSNTLAALSNVSRLLLERNTSLCEMSEEASDPLECARLFGKAEGVRLAHSILHELVRSINLDFDSRRG